jgi:capsular exopolysaccharide synthesis family protein
MNLFDALRTVRRRWIVVAAALVTGVVAGWVSAPGAAGPEQFRATHTMIVNPTVGGINLAQAAILADTGAVPERVAERLDLGPDQVRRLVTATADIDTAVLTIEATSPVPQEAAALADVTAEELVVELGGARVEAYQRELERLRTQVGDARSRVTDLQALIDPQSPDTAAQLELQAARSELTSALSALQSFEAQGAPQAPLQTVERARVRPEGAGGFQAPTSQPARAGLLGAFGLLLGLGAAFALDRLDTRIHSKRATEAAFGHPVVAEIPPLPRGAHGELLALTRPAAPFVEAYRGLRTVVALNAVPGADHGGHRVVLVASPMAGEGKTTSVAHLAATLGEVGRSVLVVSADFRRPRVHQYFGHEREPGLTDALSGRPGAPGLAELVRSTEVPGVFLLASGSPVENPAALLERLGDLLRAARGLFDLVLVDSPPLLVANDATAIAHDVDAVLLMARSGRTTFDAAERSAEILERIGAKVAGVVLTAAHDTPTAYRHYRYRYYAETEAPKRRFGRRTRAASPAPSPAPGGDGQAKAAPVGGRPADLVEQER